MSARAPQIFVSHSQYDIDIRKSFSEIFAIAGVMPKYMEFERIYPPAWAEIKAQIKISEAVFLLLGPNIRRSSFTENWVAFEAGLSCAFGKDVWVFEPMDSHIDFPIPYLTDYMLYNLDIQDHFGYVRCVMEGYKRPLTIFPLGDARTKRNIPKGVTMNCTHENCLSNFQLHTDVPNLYCPVCRQIINRPETV
jgi:hypothetical protein